MIPAFSRYTGNASEVCRRKAPGPVPLPVGPRRWMDSSGFAEGQPRSRMFQPREQHMRMPSEVCQCRPGKTGG